MQTDPSQAGLENEPWYRNQMVWLVIAIPSLTVIGCLFTIYLALSHPDPLVHDAAPGDKASLVRK